MHLIVRLQRQILVQGTWEVLAEVHEMPHIEPEVEPMGGGHDGAAHMSPFPSSKAGWAWMLSRGSTLLSHPRGGLTVYSIRRVVKRYRRVKQGAVEGKNSKQVMADLQPIPHTKD